MKHLVHLVLILVFQAAYCDWSLIPIKEINYLYKRTECKHFNPKFIDKFTCRNVFVNRSKVSSTIEFNFRPEYAPDQVFLEVTSYKKFGTVYRPTLIKLKENLCDISANKSNSYVAQQLRKIFSTSITNFLEPCPLKGRKYFLGKKYNNERNYYFERSLPPLVPIGDWKIVVNFTTEMNGPAEFILEITKVYEVTQKTATQF